MNIKSTLTKVSIKISLLVLILICTTFTFYKYLFIKNITITDDSYDYNSLLNLYLTKKSNTIQNKEFIGETLFFACVSIILILCLIIDHLDPTFTNCDKKCCQIIRSIIYMIFVLPIFVFSVYIINSVFNVNLGIILDLLNNSNICTNLN